MLESLIKKGSENQGPGRMFFVGLVYASLSLLLVHYFFPNDSLANGMTVVAFCIMFTLPYMIKMIRREEVEDEQIEGFMGVWKIHSDAIYGFMWLFLGFVIAFSFWHIILGDPNLLNFQIETYCKINSPGNVDGCISNYLFSDGGITGASIKEMRFLSILENNVYVMIFTLLFSLVFGAGAIFILVWNASVIAAAIGFFTKNSLAGIPLGIGRYMIHGLPEIAAYFIAALAGGIFGVGILRNGIRNPKSWKVIENAIILIFIAILILIVAAAMEVYITPLIFN